MIKRVDKIHKIQYKKERERIRHLIEFVFFFQIFIYVAKYRHCQLNIPLNLTDKYRLVLRIVQSLISFLQI